MILTLDQIHEIEDFDKETLSKIMFYFVPLFEIMPEENDAVTALWISGIDTENSKLIVGFELNEGESEGTFEISLEKLVKHNFISE